MALVNYLNWEVRTTGHDLNCSGFNRNRDTTNGVDYTQQDNAEITSLNWVVDSSYNTRIRSEDLTNWINSGKALASLKGNHIHIAGMAIAGGVLFDWVASTGKPGAYYLQAKGGGNPSWTTKPARMWLNKIYTPENTNLPAGSNTWAWGDWDSLGYNTIYVRFGAENDANPSEKNQDDVIADGKTWSRGAYEIVSVGTDASGPFLVLDRSPAAVNSQNGYGRIGGAMASPGGVGSVTAVQGEWQGVVFIRYGIYSLNPSLSNQPTGLPSSTYNCTMLGYHPDKPKGAQLNPEEMPTFICGNYSWSNNSLIIIQCKFVGNMTSASSIGIHFIRCICQGLRLSANFFACYLENGFYYSGSFCYFKNSTGIALASFSIIDSCVAGGQWDATGPYRHCVFYNSSSSGILGGANNRTQQDWEYCVAINCARYGYEPSSGWNWTFRTRVYRCFWYQCTLGGHTFPNWRTDIDIVQLPGNPFRDPANGDFRLADNEAGRMLKQAGFQIPGPQGAPPLKFDAGAVQNSFYDYIKTIVPPPIHGA